MRRWLLVLSGCTWVAFWAVLVFDHRANLAIVILFVLALPSLVDQGVHLYRRYRPPR